MRVWQQSPTDTMFVDKDALHDSITKQSTRDEVATALPETPFAEQPRPL